MRGAIIMATLLFVAVSTPGLATASAIGDDTPSSDKAKDPAESTVAAEAKEPGLLEIPPGFKPKKRGDITLYCI
jgi:hypothetical protein